VSKVILECTGKVSRKSLSEGSFQNRILFWIKYKVLFYFATAAGVAAWGIKRSLAVFMALS
jgi:hypothetical protein